MLELSEPCPTVQIAENDVIQLPQEVAEKHRQDADSRWVIEKTIPDGPMKALVDVTARRLTNDGYDPTAPTVKFIHGIKPVQKLGVLKR